MIKKASIYLLAIIGALSILIFSYYLLSSRAGTTMYGGSIQSVPGPMGASFDSNYTAFKSTQTTPLPSENVMKRMIIRNANIILQVNELAPVMDQIVQLADNSGGYVVNSNINQGANTTNGSASISIRIPAEGLNNILKQLKLLATKVVQVSVSGEDITQQYVNLESQLENLNKSKSQLDKIMLGAKKTEDVLKVFQQLSDTQGRIDVLEGQIKYFKESVALSLINITLNINPVIENDRQKQWRLTEIFRNSYQSLINGLRNSTYVLIEFSVYYLPLIILWSGISLLIFWIMRKIYILFMRKSRKKAD